MLSAVGRVQNLILVGLPLGAFLGLIGWRLFFCGCRSGPDPAGFTTALGAPAGAVEEATAAAGTPPPVRPEAGDREAPAGLLPWPRLDLPPEPEVVVDWTEAGQYVDHVVGVEGRVVLTKDTGKVTFLNFARDWRGRFRGVIFASTYLEYPDLPARWLQGRRVRLLGRVQRYRGAPEIVVDSPAQIVLLDEDPAGGR